MTKQKLTIFALLAIVAISSPLLVEAARTTWIGVDCDPLKGGNVATCNDINELNKKVDTLGKIYYVTMNGTANPGQTLDLQSACNEGDALINDWIIYNTFGDTSGMPSSAGPIIGTIGGNLERDVQVGWFLTVQNISSAKIISGDATILCLVAP